MILSLKLLIFMIFGFIMIINVNADHDEYKKYLRKHGKKMNHKKHNEKY